MIAAAETHKAMTAIRQVLHERMRELADIQPAQHGAGQAQGRCAQGVLAGLLYVGQIAQPGQGVGQSRHCGLRQLAAARELEVAQRTVLVPEAGQQLQATSQRLDEMTVRLVACRGALGRPALRAFGHGLTWLRMELYSTVRNTISRARRDLREWAVINPMCAGFAFVR